MEKREEMNKKLEEKLKKYEDSIMHVISYNKKLKEALENIKAEERLTFEWLSMLSNSHQKD
ncbi:hypothetical protein HK407_07g11800 [Ordospora pajunii]|jgi:hypothetical protein|uniref:uncharacterized protein n=1 Tax=Ordospora pajunii TaxID=3039483 RepID=UPI0029527A6A|nr:uncharacterized protein HK407_07g11800 [Ordospora pajunii]KAH9411188.1 hypothetical protein HK407_07g11800 [Ordospora pajunii]